MQPAPVAMASTGGGRSKTSKRFNEADPKYKCCCQSCHIKQGAMILGIVETVCVGLQLLGSLLSGQFGQAIVTALVWVPVLVCLFYGLMEERSGFLIPHLVVQNIAIILIGVVGCIVLGTLVGLCLEPTRNLGFATNSKATMVTVLAFALIVILEGQCIWFFTVIFRCYRYLMDKRNMVQVPMIWKKSPVIRRPIPMTFAQPAVTGYPQQPIYGFVQQQAVPPIYDFKQ